MVNQPDPPRVKAGIRNNRINETVAMVLDKIELTSDRQPNQTIFYRAPRAIDSLIPTMIRISISLINFYSESSGPEFSFTYCGTNNTQSGTVPSPVPLVRRILPLTNGPHAFTVTHLSQVGPTCQRYSTRGTHSYGVFWWSLFVSLSLLRSRF